MIEYYDVSGCYILRPWSYAIWESIKVPSICMGKNIGFFRATVCLSILNDSPLYITCVYKKKAYGFFWRIGCMICILFKEIALVTKSIQEGLGFKFW